MKSFRPRALTGAILLGVGMLASASAVAAGFDEGAGPEWARVLEAARKEGNVVVMGRPDLGPAFAAGFKRDTGLGLDYLGGQTQDLQARFHREAASGTVVSDILLGGETSVDMIKPGYLMPLAENILLPKVKDPTGWIDGRLVWGDNQRSYLFIGGEYVHGWPAFNTDLVKPGDVTSWRDILKPRYRGKIAAVNPGIGPGGAAASYLVHQFGIDFFKRLVTEQQMTVARDGRQVVEWLVRGTHAVAIGAVPADVEYFRSRGINNIAVGDLPDGPGALLGGSIVLTVASKAPHRNAAIVFLNWYASQLGQESFSRVWKTPSNRTDVSLSFIPEYTKRRPNRTYLEQYREDYWMAERVKVQQQIDDIMEGR
jgi:ABC-type Fe3+ transport system substrate-binding protein